MTTELFIQVILAVLSFGFIMSDEIDTRNQANEDNRTLLKEYEVIDLETSKKEDGGLLLDYSTITTTKQKPVELYKDKYYDGVVSTVNNNLSIIYEVLVWVSPKSYIIYVSDNSYCIGDICKIINYNDIFYITNLQMYQSGIKLHIKFDKSPKNNNFSGQRFSKIGSEYELHNGLEDLTFNN